MNPIWIISFTALLFGVHCVRIEENGYKGITISLSEKALQKSFDFRKLKVVLKRASEILFHATRRRSYFEEFIFVVPSTWTDNDVCKEYVTGAPRSIDVYVTDSAEIPSLKTQHSKGCGHKGDIIYMPRDWLTGNAEDLAHHFVQQWSTFRYGVFSESPERPGSCIVTSEYSWSPTGCYNIELDSEVSFDENGLPVCYLPDDFHEEDLHSSIMFSSNSSKLLDFCDGSESFPHNPVAPTLHNRICGGYSVWSIVKNTEDFIYGRNFPAKEAKPPTFRCFKESKTPMILVVQDTDSEARTEIRYALFYFLSNVAEPDLSVSLVTFSNDTLTDAVNPVKLDLKDGEKLKSLLMTYLKLNRKVPNICLVCGLRKAYKVSAESQHPLPIIVLIAPSSSLQNTDISELTELIRSNDGHAVLYLLFLENTDNDTIPSLLVDTMQESRRRIFRVKNDRVFVFTQMNVALLDASQNILHIEDKTLVVHQKTYINVASNFLDVFLTQKNVKGKLLYSMQCMNRGDIRSDNNCSFLDQELQSPICESKWDLNGNSSKIWKYSFEYMAGSDGSTCVSLALLKMDSPSMNSFTVKGWLNENKITPGHNALIIYAEVIGKVDDDIHVEAIISGPGLTDFRLELRDNGNGDPDIIKGDNIYSRYFTSFTQKGTYTVSIYAAALAVQGNITEDNLEKTENITAQTKVIDSFRVTESPPKEDIIPPNRVSDLKVISIDNTNYTVLLQWTAPGDNYDDGKAMEYKIYFTDDWRNLQEILLNKILYRILNTSKVTPEISGNEEKEVLQLPNNSLPTIYYIALKALDKSGNEGSLSNIIQVPLMLADFDCGNLTTENDTDDDTNTVTSSLKENAETNKYIYTIAGSALGLIILIIIIINILTWIICFRKYKKNHKARKLNEVYDSNTKVLQTGININSDENIMRSEYENNHIYERRQSGDFSHNQNAISENAATRNPLLLYAKVQKRGENQESTSVSTQNAEGLQSQQIQILNQKEKDMGFV